MQLMIPIVDHGGFSISDQQQSMVLRQEVAVATNRIFSTKRVFLQLANWQLIFGVENGACNFCFTFV